MMIITSRDPGAPPVSYIKVSGGIFKDMLIHDFDMFRFVLGDEAETVYAAGSCLVDATIADAGDIDSSVVTIRTRRGRLCQINTSRRAVYGYDQRFEEGNERCHGACTATHRDTRPTRRSKCSVDSGKSLVTSIAVTHLA